MANLLKFREFKAVGESFKVLEGEILLTVEELTAITLYCTFFFRSSRLSA